MTVDAMQDAIGEQGLQRGRWPVVVLTENQSTYRGENPDRAELLRYEVDGALLDGSSPACDYLLALPWCGETGAVVFVELKGSHVHSAAAQILASIERLRAAVGPAAKYARIVASRVDATEMTAHQVRRLKQLLGPSRVRMASRLMVESLAAVGRV